MTHLPSNGLQLFAVHTLNRRDGVSLSAHSAHTGPADRRSPGHQPNLGLRRRRGEFEYVKAKPLGDGFTGVPVREIRGAVLRPFLENRMSVGANFLLAGGYTGQTTETLALPSDPLAFERVVGVPLKSYVSLSWTYYFGK